MTPDPKVTRKPAVGKAFSLDDSGAIPSQLLQPGRWYYATPVSPATSPSDNSQLLADRRNKAFLNGAANVALPDATYSPLRWRIRLDGKKEIEGAIGGMAVGAVVVTLPPELWPIKDVVRPILSTDGTHAMAVSISALTGNVTFLGPVSAGTVTEGNIGLSDVTTDNVTSSAHGLAPKSPADATKFLNGATTPDYAQVKDSDLATTDITTNNASTSKHGFLKKLSSSATDFLDGTGAFDTVKDSDLSTSDITTNDVTTAKHGFTPKAPNDTAKFLRGDASWATIGGTGTALVASDPIWDAKGDLAAATGADAAVKVTVGTDHTTLRADSSQTAGVAWEPGGSVLLYDYTVSGSDKASIDTGADTPDAGTAGTSAFSGAYRILEIWFIARTDDAAASVGIAFTLNNDTGANYDRETDQGVNATASAVNTLAASNIGLNGHGTGGTASYAGVGRLTIPGYAGTTFFKSIMTEDGINDGTAGNNTIAYRCATYRSTSALTRVKMAPSTGGAQKLKVGSRLVIFAR